MDNTIVQVIEKIKNFYHLKGDAEVARMIGLTKTGLYNHKVRGTIPYKALSKFCKDKQISLDWLLSDEDALTQKASQVSEPATSYGGDLNLELLKEIIEVVEQQLKVLDISLDAKKKAEIIDYIYVEMLKGKGEDLGKIAQKLITLAA